MEQHDTPGMFMIVGTRRSVVTLMDRGPRVSIPDCHRGGSEPDLVVVEAGFDFCQTRWMIRRCRSQLERRAGLVFAWTAMYLGAALRRPVYLRIGRSSVLARWRMRAVLLACAPSPGGFGRLASPPAVAAGTVMGVRERIVINGTSAWLLQPGSRD